MQKQYKNTGLIPKTALYSNMAALLLSLFLFGLSLPRIGFGLWPQSELAITGLHLISALNIITLSVFLINKPKFSRILAHPFVLLPLSIALLSIIFLPFSDFPLRSLTGSIRLGDGILWWIDLSALSASAILQSRFKPLKKILIFAALTSFAMTFILCVAHHLALFHYAPYFFPDFLAFMVITIPVLISAAYRNIQRNYLYWIALVGIVNFLIYFTNNRIALLYTTLGYGALFTIWFYAPLKKHRESLSPIILTLIPVMALAGTLLISNTLFEGYYDAFNKGLIRSFVSRGDLIETVITPALSSPAHLITGYGWGHFFELLTANLPTDWVNFNFMGQQQWDGIRTDHFHSHNMFVETFISAGILAVAIFLAYIISFYIYAKKSLKFPALLFAAGLASIASFWFILPLCVPFLALTAGLIARPKIIKFPAILKRPAILIALAAIIIALQTLTSSGTILHAKTSHLYQAKPQSAEELNCTLDLDDHGLGGLSLAKILIDRSRFTSAKHEELLELSQKEEEGAGDTENEIDPEKTKTEILKEIERLNTLYCQSVLYMDQYKPSIRLRLARLTTRAEILIVLSSYINQDTEAYYYANWGQELAGWLHDYPGRADLAVPFLSYHLIHGDDKTIGKITNIILSSNKDDPAGLWFQGIIKLNDPAQSRQGLIMMRKALENGIERYLPVEDDLKQKLGFVE